MDRWTCKARYMDTYPLPVSVNRSQGKSDSRTVSFCNRSFAAEPAVKITCICEEKLQPHAEPMLFTGKQIKCHCYIKNQMAQTSQKPLIGFLLEAVIHWVAVIMNFKTQLV